MPLFSYFGGDNDNELLVGKLQVYRDGYLGYMCISKCKSYLAYGKLLMKERSTQRYIDSRYNKRG